MRPNLILPRPKGGASTGIALPSSNQVFVGSMLAGAGAGWLIGGPGGAFIGAIVGPLAGGIAYVAVSP